MPLTARGLPGSRFTLMVYLEDCTGCGLCVETCPISAPADPGHKAINLAQREPRLDTERAQHRVLRDPAHRRPLPG